MNKEQSRQELDEMGKNLIGKRSETGANFTEYLSNKEWGFAHYTLLLKNGDNCEITRIYSVIGDKIQHSYSYSCCPI